MCRRRSSSLAVARDRTRQRRSAEGQSSSWMLPPPSAPSSSGSTDPFEPVGGIKLIAYIPLLVLFLCIIHHLQLASFFRSCPSSKPYNLDFLFHRTRCWNTCEFTFRHCTLQRPPQTANWWLSKNFLMRLPATEWPGWWAGVRLQSRTLETSFLAKNITLFPHLFELWIFSMLLICYGAFPWWFYFSKCDKNVIFSDSIRRLV